MFEIEMRECPQVAGGGALEKIGWTFFSMLATRAYNTLDAALACPGNDFESSPFLDAVAAGNQTA